MPEESENIKAVTVFVCVTCGQQQGQELAAGERVYARLIHHLADNQLIRLQKVKCMGGCNHPCAVAFTSPQKLIYIYGNINADDQLLPGAVVAYAEKYLQSETGLVPAREKPTQFANVLMRIPPADWHSADGSVTSKTDGPTESEIAPDQAIFMQSFDS